MPDRDPRLDPRPGDVLRFGQPYNRQYIEVLLSDPRYADSDVAFFDCSWGRERVMSLAQWKKKMKGAGVVLVAEAERFAIESKL